MIDPSNISVVADNELLARFIVYSDEKRPDGTVKHKRRSQVGQIFDVNDNYREHCIHLQTFFSADALSLRFILHTIANLYSPISGIQHTPTLIVSNMSALAARPAANTIAEMIMQITITR